MNEEVSAQTLASVNSAPAVETPRRPFAYSGRLGALTKIVCANSLLSIVTLGVYRFWGKTRLRRYFWGHIAFDGEPFEYSGRGVELFIGFLIVAAIIVPAGYALNFLYVSLLDRPILLAITQIAQVLVLYFLIYVAMFRARRYMLSRTQWRGIRGAQTGSSLHYGLRALLWNLATVLTLGLAYPVMATRLQSYKFRNTWFGTKSLTFDGKARALLRRWLIAWLLIVPTLGASLIWYGVHAFRYYVAQTRFGNLAFASDLGTGRVLWIVARYFSFAILTILIVTAIFVPIWHVLEVAASEWGVSMEDMTTDETPNWPVIVLFVPFALLLALVLGVIRVVSYLHPLFGAVSASLTVTGEEDLDAIRQAAQERPMFGEGLADALNVGSI